MGNYLGDIVSSALSEDTALAITATEVFEAVARGGLGAPNDVIVLSSCLTLVLPYACGS